MTTSSKGVQLVKGRISKHIVNKVLLVCVAGDFMSVLISSYKFVKPLGNAQDTDNGNLNILDSSLGNNWYWDGEVSKVIEASVCINTRWSYVDGGIRNGMVN